MLLGLVLGPSLTAVLAVTSPLLTISRALPQVVRVVRAGAKGVSAPTWMLLVVLAELWAIYGVVASVPAEVVTNVPTALLAFAIVVLVARRRSRLRGALTTAALLTFAVAVFSGACIALHRDSLEADAAVAGSLAIYLPQFAKVLRERDLDGVAPATWALACLSSVSWGAYGLLIHKVPVFLPNVVLLPIAIVILFRTTRARGAVPKSLRVPTDIAAR